MLRSFDDCEFTTTQRGSISQDNKPVEYAYEGTSSLAAAQALVKLCAKTKGLDSDPSFETPTLPFKYALIRFASSTTSFYPIL